jgi:hypothetical protein
MPFRLYDYPGHWASGKHPDMESEDADGSSRRGLPAFDQVVVPSLVRDVAARIGATAPATGCLLPAGPILIACNQLRRD